MSTTFIDIWSFRDKTYTADSAETICFMSGSLSGWKATAHALLRLTWQRLTRGKIELIPFGIEALRARDELCRGDEMSATQDSTHHCKLEPIPPSSTASAASHYYKCNVCGRTYMMQEPLTAASGSVRFIELTRPERTEGVDGTL